MRQAIIRHQNTNTSQSKRKKSATCSLRGNPLCLCEPVPGQLPPILREAIIRLAEHHRSPSGLWSSSEHFKTRGQADSIFIQAPLVRTDHGLGCTAATGEARRHCWEIRLCWKRLADEQTCQQQSTQASGSDPSMPHTQNGSPWFQRQV